MSTGHYVFTSESVSEGHPDKIADQVSDAILDEHLRGDPNSRCAIETLVKNSYVIIAGEITSSCEVDYDKVTRGIVEKIGYNDPAIGFDHESCEVLLFTNAQSSDISMGVNEGEGSYKEQGAGDQGLMFGFACLETPELMPLPISLSHRLMETLAIKRKNGADFLRPDSKAQVTVKYDGTVPVAVDTVVLSTQHTEEVDSKRLEEFIIEEVVKEVLPAELITAQTKYLINPTGRFVIGGPVGDAGLTGRKIIVDTYGGYSRHGGGAFSGKDPSKVDRSAAYAARYIAKNIVASGAAERCEVQLAYAIGVAAPVSVFVDTFGTGKAPESKISAVIQELFDLRPRGIVEMLQLKSPIFLPTAAYGHFGRSPSVEGHFSWEKTDKAEAIKKALS